MMINSQYLVSGAPITCAHCKKPFPVENGHVVAWRTSTGRYFCNEFCAEDEEELAFQDHRRRFVDHTSVFYCRGARL